MITIWTIVDGNTWELASTRFFKTEDEAVAAAEFGEIIVGLDIGSSGSEKRTSYQITVR